ncbi:MAG: hypothetical protein ACK5MB_06260 [Phycisphaerales bacterium]|jgi:hypothetical protein
MSNVRMMMMALALMMIAAAAMILPACVQTAVAPGTRAQIDAATGRVENSSPITIGGVFEPDGRETLQSTGTGPAGYAVVNDQEARWWAQNQTQRTLYTRRLPDGTLIGNVASGTDINIRADNAKVDPKTGIIDLKGFALTTTASEPTRASNEAYDRLVAYWVKLSEDQRALVIEQLKAQGEVGQMIGDVLGQAIRTAAGAP